jgi:hypothetical protein
MSRNDGVAFMIKYHLTYEYLTFLIEMIHSFRPDWPIDSLAIEWSLLRDIDAQTSSSVVD